MLFTFGQVWVGIRQARIAREQTKIAAKTRDIAVAALGRPYVFFEFLSHNMEEWRSGRDRLRFVFRFTNHGAGPAVVEFIHAKAILSYGPYSRHDDAGNLVKPGIVQPFPPKENLVRHVSWNAQVPYAPVSHGEEPEEWDKGSLLVLKAGKTSRPFRASLHLPPLDIGEDAIARTVQQRLHDATGPDGDASAWLLGSITYQSPFGGQHWTNFCVRARRDGTASTWDEHPYTERT